MYRGDVSSVFCVQNWMTAKSVFTIFRLLLIFNIGAIFPVLCQSMCPSTDKLQQVSFACFDSFSTQRANLEQSGRRLFSGIDVEILRAYCSAYIDGMTCIKQLMDTCPSSVYDDIKIGITHLKGTEEELADLCRTQSLYEIYAQYMTCFIERGDKSDWCMDTKLGNPGSTLPQSEFCSRVREGTQCVEHNIRQGCGEKAAELVHLLVKPTIQGSGSCTYDVYNTNTEGQPTVIKGGTPERTAEPGKRHTNNSSSPSNSSIVYSSNMILMAITIITTILSTQTVTYFTSKYS